MYVCAKPSSMPVENCPPFLGGDPWKMGAHFQAWPQPFFETLLLAQKQSFCFSQRKKNQCKKWKCAGSTYFKSKFWYNREFSLCYVDKLVQIWFLSLPWQLLDISIFLRDFFAVKQYVPHPNLSGSHVCTQRNFHHVQAKKSYDWKWFLSGLVLCAQGATNIDPTFTVPPNGNDAHNVNVK